MKIFLDTSVLSDTSFASLAETLAEQALAGDTFLVSSLTHFQILWGYSIAKLSSTRYETFLEKFGVEVASLVEEDATVAARKRPSRSNIVDALIAATVSRYEAIIWTKDSDFLEFLPPSLVKMI
ncbi:MAG: type II toxin-antitoxin system VapC family toxin [Candidatus Bathyarchaeia archaeon]|jgi:predicted nucleic acid-binding protein